MQRTMKTSALALAAAVFAAVALTLALAVPAFASSKPPDTAVPSPAENSSTTTLVASTGNNGDTLNAYKVVEVTLESNVLNYAFTEKFATFLTSTAGALAPQVDYSGLSVDGYKELPQAAESGEASLQDLLGAYTAYVRANGILPEFSTTTSGTSGTFSDVGLGQYIIVGMGNTSGSYVYGTSTANIVPAEGASEYVIYDAYEVDLKTNVPIADKTITGGTSKDTAGENSYDTVNVGDAVNYELTAQLPVYAASATNKTVFLADELSDGLSLMRWSIKVYGVQASSARTELSADTDYELTYSSDGQTFYVNFDYDRLIAGSYTSVAVTYSATVNEEAVVGVEEGNPNTLVYYYSNSPFNGTTFTPGPDQPTPGEGYGQIEDTETVYTYGIYIHKTASDTGASLAGAVFDLYAGTNKIAQMTTDDRGYAVFNGIAAGTYTLKETKAPMGYKLASDVQIVLNASSATSKVQTQRQENTTEWNGTTTTTAWRYYSNPFFVGQGQAQNRSGQYLWVVDKVNNPLQHSGMIATATQDASSVPAGYVPAYEDPESKTVYVVTNNTAPVVDSAGAGYYPANIVDVKGIDLPTTGGIGTYIFYALGAGLVIAAAAFLVKKRKGAPRE